MYILYYERIDTDDYEINNNQLNRSHVFFSFGSFIRVILSYSHMYYNIPMNQSIDQFARVYPILVGLLAL